MIELYGNKIWNSNTPNKYKKVIIANEDSFDNICQELENSGLNYCAYIFNGEAHIAIGRATATNIDKLDIDYQTVIECNSKVYKTNNIIGTTTYDSIEDKLYRKYNTDFAYKIGQRLTEQGILFSGRIYGKTTTITVDEQYADTLNKISAELKEQRASFMSKSEIVQNESPEELKSVDEKISELHFNESQLSALAPSVKFIQTRNDDNLTDNFVSLFSDCTDFYESQLSALAEIYVDTYQSFSDKSLMFADTSRFNDLKQRFVNDNITAKLTENRGYSTTQLEIIREMVTYGMSESVINLLDYTFSTDEMQNYFSAYKNGSYEDLINIIAEIKGTTRTDIEGQIEGGTYTPKIPEIAEGLTADTQKLIADVADAEMIKSGELTESESYYAKELINSYCRDEFDSEADFSDLKKVGVAYTTTEDSKHTVEAVVNLVDYRLETYVDDKLFKEKTYSSLKDMIDNCLYSLSFDDLVYLSDDELAQLEPKEHRAVPLAENDYYNSVVKQDLKRALYHIDNAKSDAERNFYQNNFDIKVRNYAGALNVSSEEIVNQFNSENEIVPINEPEQTESVQEIIRPTITCDWSESPVFENGKTYSVSEFDKLMKNADDEWVEQRQLEIEEYGSENAVTEAYRNGELDNIHLGYEKTKFIINMPNGTKYTERQDIGDGRKLGLDPRLINPSFEDDPGTKLNVCVNNVFDIYEKTSDKKLTQIVFCDLGVPSKNSSADGNKDDDTKSVAELDSLEESGKFCVYDDIRDKLIAKGVSADEIAYIHNAKSETQKSELFAKVRSGEVRILLGSTGKMGTGTNVQDRIIALHDLDVPWRPSDLEQRRGRMVRQGNINDKVHLYRYVTKGTFDAYSYQLLEKKQKFISQIMTSKEPGRKCADVDQAALTYSEIKALCTGDERIREKLTLENRVKELQALKSEYNSTRYELEDKVNAYPEERKKLLLDIGNISKDMETVKNIPFDVKTESYRVKITIGKDAYSLLDDESRKVAAKALTNAVAQVKGDANKNKRIAIGGLGNFGVEIINDGYFLDKITATLRGNYTYSVELGVSSIINLKKIENLLFKVENVLNDKKSELNKLDIDYKTAQNMLHKPFEFEDELNNSTKRLDELTTALNIDMSEHKVDKPKKTHYFGKDFILGKNKSSKQIQNNEVMKSEPKRSEQEL